MPKSASPKPVEELTYEEAFTELERIVSVLEDEQNPLEKSMLLFERGQALVRRCGELLEGAELRVRKLSGDEMNEFKSEE